MFKNPDEKNKNTIKNLQLAAEQGDANAQSLLATCYHYGRGVEQSDAKAVYWLNKAAAQGVQIPKVILDLINN